VIVRPHVDWFALAPSLSLLAASGLLLMVAVFVPATVRRGVAASVGFAGFVAGGIWAGFLAAKSPQAQLLVHDAMVRDRWGSVAQVVLAACGAIAVLIAYRERLRTEHVAEYFALLTAVGAGMMFFVQAANLMTLFLGLEWFSIGLYVLTAIDIDLVGSLEAGLKYLIVGAVGSATLLFGSALVYGVTGQLSFDKIAAAGHAHDAMLVVGLAMIIVGFAFKASAAPFHMWTPDAYQGAPTSVTAFMSSATKVAALVVMYRVLVTAFPHEQDLWRWAVAIIALVSLAWGNIAALAQRNVKRILAYSSVSHAGFMMIAIAAGNPLGERALLYYLIPYSAMSLGAFGVVAARERELGTPVTLQNLAGFGWERPFLGVAMTTFVFGMLGFPLTGGFIGKFYVFAAAWDGGFEGLIVAGVIATMISAYYYLGVVRAMYFRDSVELRLAPAGGSPPQDAFLALGVGLALVVTVGSFFAVQPLIDVAHAAASSLPPLP
jgi:NADH-quinone oxidoreductase subunit N